MSLSDVGAQKSGRTYSEPLAANLATVGDMRISSIHGEFVESLGAYARATSNLRKCAAGCSNNQPHRVNHVL